MTLSGKVYKYRDCSNGFHKNLLLYNELYLASPKDFKDPFDCRIPPNFIDLTQKEKNDYINDLAISRSEESREKGLDFKNVLNNLEDRFKNSIEAQKYFEKLLFTCQDKYYGVLSLSTRWNSILMWSHYSNCHKGFCVGFWEEKLRNSGHFGKGGIVYYDTKFPNIKPKVTKDPSDIIEKTFIQTHTKSEDWTNESEYRLVQNYFPKEPKSFERIININDDVFSEVILGINISESSEKEIVAICKKKNIPVYKAKQKDFLFEIDRELIK
jgi:hypothetical protein